MAVGTGFGLDLSTIDNALKEADNKIKSLTNQTHNLSKTTINAFQQMTNQGVIPYVESLKRQAKALENLGAAAGKSGLTTLQADAKLAVDEINKVVDALQKAYRREQSGKDALSFSKSVLSGRGEVKSIENMRLAIQRLEEAQNRQNLKTQTGRNNYKKIGQEIERVQLELRRATGENNSFIKSLGNIGKAVVAAFSVQAIRGYVNQMIKVRGEMELQQRSLQAILQNKDAANEVWQKTIDLAIKSPFRIKDLVTYTKQLAAYRVESEKLFETNKMLADVSAGLGVDMNRLILAFGQVKAANFLRGTELRQFTEAGIPMLDELAKHFNEMNNTALTSGDVFEMISKRMVLFEDVEAVFKRITSAGGTFYRMQEIQSETLKGQISNLKDSLDIMLNEIGKANDGTLKVSVKAVKLLVDNYEKIIPILKSSVVLFAIYKTNALWAARSITTMKGAWDAFTVSWGRFSKTLTLNPWMLWLSAIVAVGTAIHKVWKQFDDVDKQYNNMLNQQSEITSKFFKAKDINEQKKALKELIDLANKEYEFGIEVDIKSVPDDEVKKYMNDLRQRMIEANAFGATFQKELITANLKTKWTDLVWWQSLSGGGIFEQGLNKDIDQMGDSYDNLNRLMVNKLAPTIDELSSKWSTLNDSQKDALASLKAGIGEWAEAPDEDMVEYFDRIRKNFELLIESDAVADKKLGRQLRKYQRRMQEAEKEFQTFIDGIDETVMGVSEEDRTIFLNAAIDDAKAQKNWSEFEETQIRKWLEKKYEIELTPKIAEGDTDLKAWQDSYNSLFKGSTGYREIRSKDTTQKQVVDQLNAQYESTAELLERIQKAGEDSVLEGGAYEGEDLAKLKQDLVEIRMQLEWFGAEAKKDNKDEAAVKILQRRINLLKEVNKKYLELEKTFGSIEAKEKVMEAYSDTFREAFAGTGVDLDMYKIMTQVVTDSKKVGEDAGSSFSEGMIAKLKELEEAGTYIRTFSDDYVEELKSSLREGFRDTAYWLEGEYWDKAKKIKKYTYGYGFTTDENRKPVKKGMTITREEADLLLIKKLTEEYAKDLNDVLDINKDLIVTQEQYNQLLDVTYQGGKGAIQTLISRARDIDKGAAHIQSIYSKVAKVFGEDKAARYGDAFVEKFRQAENVLERIAILLEVTNLTTGGAIIKSKPGVFSRADDRASAFRGDLDIAKQLETVLVRIAGMDFTTTEGMVDALSKLKDIAKKEGEEAQKILSQVISGFEAEIGIRLKKEEAEKIRNEVQEIFDTYNLSLDIKKLHIPPKVAKTFFDVDMLSFDEMRDKVISTFAGTSDKVKEELNKGLLAANWNIVGEVIGKDQVEAVKKALETIDDLEDKQQKERFKKYLEYAKSTVGERAKIKLEELQKLKEIEETFAIKEGDSDETKAYKWDMMKRARDKAKQESKDAMSSLEWDEFQKTDTFTSMFEDIDFASDALLSHMISKLKEFKNEWTDMPLEDVKTIVDKLNELEGALAERSPWKAYRSAKEAVKKAREEAMYSFESEDARKVYGKGKSDKDYVEALQIENEYQEQKALNAEREIAAIEEVLALKTKEQEGNVGNLNLTEEQLAYISMQEEELRKILGEKKSEVKFSRQIITDNSKTLSQYKNQAKSLLQQSEYLGKVQQMANDLYEAFSELAEALGADSDSPAAIFADMGMNMLNTVLNTIQLQLQLHAATIAAQGLGVAMNAAMGVVGWIVMAVQLLAQVITAIVQANDKKIDAQVERLRAQVEELEKKYDKLADTIDEVYSTAALEETSRKLDEIYYKEQRALRQAIAVRKADKNISDDELDEIAEMEEQLLELEEKHAESMKEIISNATDGILDSVKDAARDFTDAWYDAFVETGKGISGLEENFSDMFMNLAKQQASMQITQAFVDKWKRDLSKYVNEKDTELTPEDAKAWAEDVKATFPELSNALEAFLGTIHETVGGLQSSGELSALQKGIQGITEETAQIIEAYLNSIRGYVSEQVTHTRNIYNILKQATTSDAAAIRVRMVE